MYRGLFSPGGISSLKKVVKLETLTNVSHTKHVININKIAMNATF